VSCQTIEEEQKMKAAFIGLGIMGSRMAKNLLKNGVSLTVFNRSPGPMQELEKSGAKTAASALDAVRDSDIVFTMLPSPEVVEQVVLSETGCLSGMKDNAIWVDCSTVNPSFSVKACQVAEKRGIRFIDGPVIGTKYPAAVGELVFIAGGDKALLAEIEPLLKFMGNRIIHAGETGKGASFKMVFNALLAQSMLVFAETVIFGEKLGLSKDFLLDTLPNLAVSAPFTKPKAEMIRTDNYEVQFPLEWMYKDLHLAALTAYEHDQPLCMANLAKELYASAKQSGLGREDFSAIYKSLKKTGGGA